MFTHNKLYERNLSRAYFVLCSVQWLCYNTNNETTFALETNRHSMNSLINYWINRLVSNVDFEKRDNGDDDDTDSNRTISTGLCENRQIADKHVNNKWRISNFVSPRPHCVCVCAQMRTILTIGSDVDWAFQCVPTILI